MEKFGGLPFFSIFPLSSHRATCYQFAKLSYSISIMEMSAIFEAVGKGWFERGPIIRPEGTLY